MTSRIGTVRNLAGERQRRLRTAGTLDGSVRQDVGDDIETHAKRLLALLGRIRMDSFILETVPQIRIESIQHHEPPFVEQAESARGTAVVLVNFRQTSGEVVLLVKDRMRKGQLDQVLVGKDAVHLAAEGGVDAVVVVTPKEAAAREIRVHALDFGGCEAHVAVPRHEEEGMPEERLVEGSDDFGIVD